ncbi:kinase-like domain-containing protein [Suillus bovinus]|uniref:kinase-like domain-containing protein n=1 Tax=Suillus bovinus TaxID=48563 RepID=UPI001B874569|nr:kinase-like domain-containing protein [Suillus bovinus]KAG2143412.1 kinase-like domain-containing protein [Suillus bovinus]
MSDPFDVIPFEDIKGEWKKLGSGSFGNVYKGSYLGIDVAIKEVLPSNSYNVAKYFEREWRLMKEARHPNVVLYLGLSRAPPPDGRIFIISEYIENGNLRMYIFDKTKSFPWRLRLSFATDICRALAYLHARKCIHRDLKGENLLVTANGRLKITDFGFARIAARNEEESKRLTFCGTDSYMSPEILLGEEFDLPTDIFSLGIIFCEIAARRLSDDRHFKRTGPTFGIDPEEVYRRASPGCPPAFLALTLDCLAEDPKARPTTLSILNRLGEIETEVLSRPDTEDLHVGSIRFMTGGRRPGAAPRIPSFGAGVGKDIRHNPTSIKEDVLAALSSGEESSDEEPIGAMQGLAVSLDPNSNWSTTANGHSGDSTQPLLVSNSSTLSEYSAVVDWAHVPTNTDDVPTSLSSILTIRPALDPNGTAEPTTPGASLTDNSNTPTSSDSIMSAQSYQTAQSSIQFSTTATKGHSSIGSSPMFHRFTSLRPGTKRTSGSASPTRHADGGWNPLELIFSSGLVGQKCDVCSKRIGWKPVLECDDCGLRAHVKCGEVAPRDCNIRSVNQPALHTSSPLSKGRSQPKRVSLPHSTTR